MRASGTQEACRNPNFTKHGSRAFDLYVKCTIPLKVQNDPVPRASLWSFEALRREVEELEWLQEYKERVGHLWGWHRALYRIVHVQEHALCSIFRASVKGLAAQWS